MRASPNDAHVVYCNLCQNSAGWTGSAGLAPVFVITVWPLEIGATRAQAGNFLLCRFVLFEVFSDFIQSEVFVHLSNFKTNFRKEDCGFLFAKCGKNLPGNRLQMSKTSASTESAPKKSSENPDSINLHCTETLSDTFLTSSGLERSKNSLQVGGSSQNLINPTLGRPTPADSVRPYLCYLQQAGAASALYSALAGKLIGSQSCLPPTVLSSGTYLPGVGGHPAGGGAAAGGGTIPPSGSSRQVY